MKCRPVDIPTTIQTPRLALKTPTMEDVAQVRDTWELDREAISREQALSVIGDILANHARNRQGDFYHLCLAIVRKEGGDWMGWCGLDHTDPRHPRPVVFYLLKRAYWKQGFATEAARALFELAFLRLELEQIDGGCAPDNLASKRVMDKIGMRYLGLDEQGGHSFTMTREEYTAHTNAGRRGGGQQEGGRM